MGLQHRALTPGDLESICAFPLNPEELFYLNPSAVYPLTPEQLWRKAAERLHPTVIVDGETSGVAAYANLYDWDGNESVCWLGNVIVSPAWRGRGAAAFLLQTMMNLARERLGARSMKLYCHNANTRAMLFYVKHGFRPNGGYKTVSDPNGQSVVAIEMESALEGG